MGQQIAAGAKGGGFGGIRRIHLFLSGAFHSRLIVEEAASGSG